MITRPKTTGLARSLLVLAAGLCLLPAAPPASAQEAPGPPSFTDPLEISHPFFPVTPGIVKVYDGREHGKDVTVVESHLEEVREFEWEGRPLPCRVVEELKFESGSLLEKDRTFYAQADDGSVWTFGTTEEGDDGEEEDDEEDEEEPNGWVVGVIAPEDPPGVQGGAAPAMAMPAAPLPGAGWTVEEVLPAFHTVFVLEGEGESVRTPAGRYRGCLRVREENRVEGSEDTHWFAPGVGLVKSRGRGERLRLLATTQR